MAITFVGSASAAADNVALPAHVAGDLIFIHAYRATNATLAVALAAGFTNILNAAANSNSDRVAYKVAASSGETSGTWTNAEAVVAVVYRGQAAAPIGASSAATNLTASAAYPALALNVTNGTSWVASFIGQRVAGQAAETPPSGMTNRVSQVITSGETAAHDTNAGVASWAGGTGGATGSNRWRINTVEILAAASGSTYNDNFSLGARALAAAGAALQATGALSLPTAAGVASQAALVAPAAMALAAAAGLSADAACIVSEALTLSTAHGLTSDGRLVVSGAISLPAGAGLSSSAQAVFASGLTFSATFDNEASAKLTAEAGLTLAALQAVVIATLSGNEVIGRVELGGTVQRTIALAGLSTPQTALSGTMQITIGLAGRLN